MEAYTDGIVVDSSLFTEKSGNIYRKNKINLLDLGEKGKNAFITIIPSRPPAPVRAQDEHMVFSCLGVNNKQTYVNRREVGNSFPSLSKISF